MRVIVGEFVKDACNHLNIDELICGWAICNSRFMSHYILSRLVIC